MDVAAKVTSKGQITIPKEVREALGIAAGDQIEFRVEEHRAVLAKTPNLMELAGAIDVPAAKRGVAWDEVRRSTRRAARSGASVTAFVDTNVLIRHLTGDLPRTGSTATALLAEAAELLLPDLIVAEVVYAHEWLYEVPTDEVARLVRSVIAFAPIRTLDPALLLRSLEVYETHRIDFAEAYLVAFAQAAGIRNIISFGHSIDRAATANRIEP